MDLCKIDVFSNKHSIVFAHHFQEVISIGWLIGHWLRQSRGGELGTHVSY